MKKTKLKIDNFLGNKLENQIMIVGGNDRTLEAPLDGETGGSTVSTGNGSGDTPPNGGLSPIR